MSLASIRKTYTHWAPFYNLAHEWIMPFRRKARLALNVQPGNQILDVACGTGANFDHLRQLAGETGAILGVDLTPAMLEMARRRIANGGWNTIQVREADAAHLPLPDASFDLVICTYALDAIPDYAGAIAEMKRVLAPGGRLVSLDVQFPDRRIYRWLSPIGMICSIDVHHRLLENLCLAFPQIQIRRYWFGLVYLAVATKT